MAFEGELFGGSVVRGRSQIFGCGGGDGEFEFIIERVDPKPRPVEISTWRGYQDDRISADRMVLQLRKYASGRFYGTGKDNASDGGEFVVYGMFTDGSTTGPCLYLRNYEGGRLSESYHGVRSGSKMSGTHTEIDSVTIELEQVDNNE